MSQGREREKGRYAAGAYLSTTGRGYSRGLKTTAAVCMARGAWCVWFTAEGSSASNKNGHVAQVELDEVPVGG